MTPLEEAWIPAACTLPNLQKPLREAEWESLLRSTLRSQARLSPTQLQWRFDHACAEAVRDLAARELACCSFFAFEFASAGAELCVEVRVPPEHVAVLDALVALTVEGSEVG